MLRMPFCRSFRQLGVEGLDWMDFPQFRGWSRSMFMRRLAFRSRGGAVGKLTYRLRDDRIPFWDVNVGMQKAV